jgi:2-phosphosulfolactate phosphatase
MATPQLDVLFTPADFLALGRRDLACTTCVVFDVLRATSTMVTALSNGAAAIIPVEEISEALALKRRHPDALLAGERDGLRIPASLAEGIGFDLGNSPREFTAATVQGKTIIMTTTNGTRALRACARAKQMLAASFLNLEATAMVFAREEPRDLLLVCSGTYEQAAYEDALAAGALCDILCQRFPGLGNTDSALMARTLFERESNLLQGASRSRNAQRLLGIPELLGDVEFCLRRDVCGVVAQMDKEGAVRRLKL